MTIQEASEQYQIPMEVLRLYESWGLCGAVKKVMGAWQYDDCDLERLSLILTLHDIDFTPQEIERYMRLLLEQAGTELQRLALLEQRRAATLEEIHLRERQVARMDYLRHQIKTAQEAEKQT